MLKVVNMTQKINQKRRPTSKNKRECVANTESKEGTITGKQFPVFNYSGEKIVTIAKRIYKSSNAYLIILTMGQKKTDKIWLCEYVGKIKLV